MRAGWAHQTKTPPGGLLIGAPGLWHTARIKSLFDEHNRLLGCPDHALRHRADQRVHQATAPWCAHDDEVEFSFSPAQ